MRKRFVRPESEHEMFSAKKKRHFNEHPPPENENGEGDICHCTVPFENDGLVANVNQYMAQVRPKAISSARSR